MENKELVLVSCSGGFDSSCTLAILQLAGYQNLMAVHFMYGHRGQAAEKQAIHKVTKELNIPLKIFNLEPIYDEMDVNSISMLANKDSKIITGTEEGLKSTAAWHPARNLLFMNMMIALAEAEIMKHNYSKVYLAGGFLQLTESATYPDNTPYFADACLRAAQYGTLVGNRLKPLYCLSNLMKYEQFALIKEFELEHVYKHTISCDRPIVKCENARIRTTVRPDGMEEKDWVIDSVPHNCSKDGLPACGSGLLSYWASKMVGLDDMKIRRFYEVDDAQYKAYRPAHMNFESKKIVDIDNIIDRILLPKEKIDYLRHRLDMKYQLERDDKIRND